MTAPDGVAGLLLAGGQSRRMRGGDKALAELGGQPMLKHVIARVRGQVSRMVLSANGDPALFARFGLPVVADAAGGFQGPLAGVLAGLRWAEAHAPKVSHLVSVSTDAPFLPRDLVERFMQIVGNNVGAPLTQQKVIVAASGGRVHPVIALWPVALADEIEAALGRGENKVQVVQERFGVEVVEYAFRRIGDGLVDPFFNVNTPEELQEAQEIIAKAGPLVIGIAGWKNSGKTTLVVGLIEELTRRGLRVATVKHSTTKSPGLARTRTRIRRGMSVRAPLRRLSYRPLARAWCRSCARGRSRRSRRCSRGFVMRISCSSKDTSVRPFARSRCGAGRQGSRGLRRPTSS